MHEARGKNYVQGDRQCSKMRKVEKRRKGLSKGRGKRTEEANKIIVVVVVVPDRVVFVVS
jgi:hypothetical protein